jgi:hypothetical protein
MWIDILAMAAVGILAACTLFIIKRSVTRRGRSFPRWILPAAIGAGMIGYSVWNEYTWYDRVTSSLPSTVAVMGHGERSAPWAPWTYIWPVTVRFIAMDARQRLESEVRTGLYVTELLLVERWQPTRRVPVAFDCQNGRRADLLGGARIDAQGLLVGAQWQSMDVDSPMLRAACNTTQSS